jgi:hypothetical protein
VRGREELPNELLDERGVRDRIRVQRSEVHSDCLLRRRPHDHRRRSEEQDRLRAVPLRRRYEQVSNVV